MGVMIVGQRRTVGMSGTDVQLMSRAGMGDTCESYDEAGNCLYYASQTTPVTSASGTGPASSSLDLFGNVAGAN